MKCIVEGCNKKAGTPWGPYFCPEHDKERLERISKGFEEIEQRFSELEKEHGDGRA